ncbi:MAG: hypothetical protein CML68_24605 [Rhodobacteraceae bacterium]|nr:hypothetical protein [Paracoccaceae bacterium]
MMPITLAFALVTLPAFAFAMPQVGDIVGTNPEDATKALKDAGCAVREFEAEDGMIEAKCVDTAKMEWEVYINPASGAVTKIKAED